MRPIRVEWGKFKLELPVEFFFFLMFKLLLYCFTP
jgi:hypothetical protein